MHYSHTTIFVHLEDVNDTLKIAPEKYTISTLPNAEDYYRVGITAKGINLAIFATPEQLEKIADTLKDAVTKWREEEGGNKVEL